MSLYDDAVVALIAEGAAGRDNVLYNIKPEEKLKATELVTNGSYDNNDAEGAWTLSATPPTFSNNQVRFQHNGSGTVNKNIQQTGVLELGKTYKVSLNVVELKEGAIRIGNGHNSNEATNVSNGGPIVTPGNHSFVFKNSTSGVNEGTLMIQANDTGSAYDFTIDNVSVKEVEQAPLDFTFTRGSNLTATRVGPGGLIEKGRKNLMTYSNQFDNAIWVGASTFTIGQQGYDGTNNAWTFAKNSDTGSDFHNDLFNGLITFSIHVKKETGNNKGIAIYAFHGYSDQNSDGVIDGGEHAGSDNCFINLETGAVVSTAGSPKHVQVDAVGNDFWRISMTVNRNNHRWFLYTTVSNILTATSITIQNAQVEDGIVATEYIPTGTLTAKAGILEDEPRFDYTGGGCPHLLMEPTRKNYYQYSEYASGNTNVTATITNNYAVSPEGLKNAFRIQHPSGTNFLRVNTPNIDITSLGDTFTFSVFVKKASSSVSTFGGFGINFFSAPPNNSQKIAYVIFDEHNGTATKVDATGDMVLHPVENYGDYWRFSASYTDTGSNTAAEGILYAMISTNGSDVTVTAGGSKDYTAYGLQFEEGAFPSSYIPNHGKSGGETRLNEFTSSTDFGDYIDGEDFTFFVDFAKNESLLRDSSSGGVIFSRNNLTAGSLRIYRASGSATTNHAVWFDNELNQHPAPRSFSGSTPKVAVRRIKSTGEWAMFVDGSNVQTQYNTNYPDFQRLKISATGSPVHLNGTIVFDRALTDDECIALTT